MTTIGGKTRTAKPSQPQWVIQNSDGVNLFARFVTTDGKLHIKWIGDPNSATKFDSKYQAKFRTRELEEVPATRCFKQLGA